MITKKTKADPPPVVMLKPQDIVVSDVIQSRVRTDPAVVSEYADAMKRGDRFPPIIVFYDIALLIYYVADGFHRLIAHLRVRPNDLIQAEQYLGTELDARWFSAGANKVHGIQRTNDDKRKAVESALLHPNGRPLSDRNIADHTGVAHTTVQRIRTGLENVGKLEKCLSRTGADGRVYNLKPRAECVCADCGHYEDSECLIEGVDRPPNNPACKEFLQAQPSEPDTVEDVEPEIDDSIDTRIYIPKEIHHRAFRRRPGEYIAVPLIKTDIEYAAWMIRNYFDDNYASALGQALLKQVREARD